MAASEQTDPTREEVNVNSPRGQKAQAWPSHLVTQVNEEDEKQRQLEMQARLQKNSKRDREREADDQELLSEHMQQSAGQNRPGGCNPCRSCLRCFFNKDESTQLTVAGGPSDAGNDGSDPPRDNTPLDTGVNNTESEESESIDEQNAQIWSNALLPKLSPQSKGKKCLVLDLDETLVHSSFQPIECSFQVGIEIDGNRHQVYVLKRPYVDEFLRRVAEHFELVVFTASLSEYANPVLDVLDQDGLIEHRLFRESCVLHEGQAYVKDLSRLGRKLKDCIIVDNSPLSYLYDPTNAIGCTSWFGDPTDEELLDMCPILNNVLKKTPDVRHLLNANTQTYQWLVEKYAGPRDRGAVGGASADWQGYHDAG